MKTVPPSLLAGLTFSLAAVLLSVASCGRPEFPISVQKTRVGLQSDVQPGERLATRRVAQSDYIGAKPGFYALRTKYDFEFFRSDLPKSRALPPKGVSFGDEMVLAGYAEPSSQADKLEIQAVVDNGSQLHVYATQFTPGDECPPAQPGVAFDMVAIPKVERPIAVHLDTGRSPPCKVVGPKAHAVCRVQQTVNWLARLSAPWQSTIECEGLSDQGARPVIDRSWFIGELAKGSTAKLTLSRSGQRVTFPIDALGKFTIKLEATDDEGRRGESVAEVNSVPPSDDTFVQFGWSAFGSTDDIETFPRIEPRVMDVGPKGTLSREACSVQSGRPWCEVTTSPTVTVFKIQETPGRYRLSLRYLDDRYAGMPIACARVFRKRALMAEMCDDTPRKGGDNWEPGVVIASQGTYEHMIVVDAGVEGGTDASEAGAREAGARGAVPRAAVDAGAVDATVPVSDGGKKATAPAKPKAK
ncbi:MAG: hypothetical protein IPG50_05295 [Myxococcales bacterium]|nr:hypothetical protein [Myxococcales bacterium]